MKVICINNSEVEGALVLGEIYDVYYDEMDDLYHLFEKPKNGFYPYRFISIPEFREKKLKRILK